MLKRLILFFGVLSLVGLVACQSPPPEVTPTQPEASSVPQPTATSAVAAPTPELTLKPTMASPSPMPQDTVAPTAVAAGNGAGPTPTPRWQIPEIQPTDWVIGGEDASLILVEYGDFQ